MGMRPRQALSTQCLVQGAAASRIASVPITMELPFETGHSGLMKNQTIGKECDLLGGGGVAARRAVWTVVEPPAVLNSTVVLMCGIVFLSANAMLLG